jgi:hypothetical protein
MKMKKLSRILKWGADINGFSIPIFKISAKKYFSLKHEDVYTQTPKNCGFKFLGFQGLAAIKIRILWGLGVFQFHHLTYKI